MHFSSTVDVVVDEKNELFNAVSLYVPERFAYGNIIDWEDFADEITPTKPVVLTLDVTNYKDIMKGLMLDQWTDAFNQDSNVGLVIYVIVFDDTQVGDWTIGTKSITYDPLTAAFEKLYFISYVKMLFDETYDGEDIVIPYPGTKAKRTISITNGTGGSKTLPAGTYVYDDGTKDFTLEVLQDIVLLPAAALTGIEIFATTVGVDADLAIEVMPVGNFTPALTGGAELLTFNTTAIVQGTNANPAPAAVDSMYFDLSLALAYQCKLNISMSFHYTLVRVHLSQDAYPVESDVDTNPCWITSKTSAEEKEWMVALTKGATMEVPKPRTQYYWGALFLIDATNSWVVVHSEDTNVFTEVLGAWFKDRNASGQYVANKLSLLRLSGPKIKPLGYPSWLNSEVNENFASAFDMLDTKNVGYLATIADNTPQDSAVMSAHGVTGLPVNALMISKFIDYACRQACAKFITSTGTLTDPVLTDEQAYSQIQEVVKNELLRFVATNRLTRVALTFPPFSVAKTGRTKLEAASAWSAVYVDDLDEITVTGGITAE